LAGLAELEPRLVIDRGGGAGGDPGAGREQLALAAMAVVATMGCCVARPEAVKQMARCTAVGRS
jgi:hypothetical protein